MRTQQRVLPERFGGYKGLVEKIGFCLLRFLGLVTHWRVLAMTTAGGEVTRYLLLLHHILLVSWLLTV